jgi:hypothetical protein
MADPMTMAAVGAVAGAALNRDDPMKGALMGAALGGAGGAGYGALTGAGGAVGAGALEAGLGAATPVYGPATMAEFAPLVGAEAMPVAMPGAASPVNMMAFPGDIIDGSLGQAYSQLGIGASPAAFAYPDVDAIARASMGSDLPGLASGASGSSAYTAPGRMPLGMASSLLQQAQPRSQMQAPAPKRGSPQSVNYGGFASLLEPKLVERRRVSLI